MGEPLLDEYAAWMRSWGASRNTIDARLSILGPRLREWGGPDGLTVDHLQVWLGSQRSQWTRATYYSHMKSLCDWLVLTSRLDEHPMQDDRLRAPRHPDSIPYPLSESEAHRALDAATGDTRAWLLLAMLAGLRAHEIAKVRGEDVAEDFVHVRGKGDKIAMIPTHPDLWALAQRYPRRGFWFPADTPEGHVPRTRISKRIGVLFRANGIDGSIHRARHLYATRLLRSGTHVRMVQKLMRHNSLKTTAGYIAVDEDEMRAAINRLSV